MKFELPPLPYAKDALEPFISAKTLEVHYEDHHKGYLEKLQAAIEGTPEASKTLEEIIGNADGDVFNNAAQVWNHTFYWMSMKPGAGGEPTGPFCDAIKKSFGSFDAFQETYVEAATGLFGSGYVWLCADRSAEKLELKPLPDAENPLVAGGRPLVCTDLWEHSYYLDYQNGREKYVRAFLDQLVNWELAAANLEAARA